MSLDAADRRALEGAGLWLAIAFAIALLGLVGDLLAG